MSFPSLSNTTPDFTLTFETKKGKTNITMKVHKRHLTTHTMPHIPSVMEDKLPSIFSSICFNPLGLPFSDEMRQTEIAHLYEHILLEYLALLNAERHGENKVYEGVTIWDWRKDPIGLFRIHINTGIEDSLLLMTAINRSNKLFQTILRMHDSHLN